MPTIGAAISHLSQRVPFDAFVTVTTGNVGTEAAGRDGRFAVPAELVGASQAAHIGAAGIEG